MDLRCPQCKSTNLCPDLRSQRVACRDCKFEWEEID
jgi:transcription initiation factor TFIIIB Brf1 subunit/transcription initiation factor TFIIB